MSDLREQPSEPCRLPTEELLREGHPSDGALNLGAQDPDVLAFDRAMASFAVSLANVMARITSEES